MTRYFDVHHTPDDTLDKVDRKQLDQNVAAWASFIYLVADSDIDFRALKAAAPHNAQEGAWRTSMSWCCAAWAGESRKPR